MAVSKINQQNEKELTVAAAATPSPSGTKSPTTEPSTKTPTEQATPQRTKMWPHRGGKNIIERKLLNGKYPNIATMATNINGGQGGGGGDLSKYDENHVCRVQPFRVQALIFFY